MNEAWYVVEAQGEGKVFDVNLRLAFARQEHQIAVWMPTYIKRQPNRHRSSEQRQDKPHPYFGRFIFVKFAMTDARLAAIRALPGVRDFLRPSKADAPSPVPDQQVEFLRETLKMIGLPNQKAAALGLAVGDRVKVAEGPFASFVGRVTRIDNRGIIAVEIDIFGRPTPILISAGHAIIEQLAKSRSIDAFKNQAQKPRLSAKRARISP